MPPRGRPTPRTAGSARRSPRCGPCSSTRRASNGPGCSASARIDPISTKSACWSPRVASAGVPIRRPEVTIGGRGSNGIALRLTVMPISWRRSSACWPSRSDSRRSTRIRWTSVPPVSTLTPPPAPTQRLGEDLGAVDRALLALAEGLGGGDLQGHRLAGDDVLERAALLAGEDGRVDLLGVLLAAEDHARRAGRRRSCASSS